MMETSGFSYRMQEQLMQWEARGLIVNAFYVPTSLTTPNKSNDPNVPPCGYV